MTTFMLSVLRVLLDTFRHLHINLLFSQNSVSEVEHRSSPFTDEYTLVQPAMQLPNMAELLPSSALALRRKRRTCPAAVDSRRESGQHDSAILSASGQAGQATSSFQLRTPGPLCPSQFSLALSTEGCCLLPSWLFTGGNWVPEFVLVTALSQHSPVVSYFLSLFLNSLSDAPPPRTL